jgi:lipopolysaccharide transport system permease protein
LVFLPFLLFLMGLTWALASLGVYLRDISQFVGIVTTATMFLSPIFYPVSALPEAYRHLLILNPLAPVIEQTREVLYWGGMPDITILSAYLAGSALIAWLGFAGFQKARKGFSDVL